MNAVATGQSRGSGKFEPMLYCAGEPGSMPTEAHNAGCVYHDVGNHDIRHRGSPCPDHVIEGGREVHGIIKGDQTSESIVSPRHYVQNTTGSPSHVERQAMERRGSDIPSNVAESSPGVPYQPSTSRTTDQGLQARRSSGKFLELLDCNFFSKFLFKIFVQQKFQPQKGASIPMVCSGT